MRTLKFRTWFYDGEDLANGMMYQGEKSFRENLIDWENNILAPTDECTILMQYTGLKEFYHHDLVETVVSSPWDSEDLITVTGEIVWVNNQWWVDCFQLIDYSGNIGDYDWKKIGTRFENPELLGDKK